MLRVITSSTHRRHQFAVEQAGRVPDLETALAEATERSGEAEARIREHEQRLQEAERGREEDVRTAESLRGQMAMVRECMAQTAGTLAGGATAQEAAHSTARMLLENADLLGLTATAPGRAALNALREAVTPARVHLLYRWGTLRSAWLTSEAAKAEAQRLGADPLGWCPGTECGTQYDQVEPSGTPWILITQHDQVEPSNAPWSIIGRTVADAAPWQLLREVVVVLAHGGAPYSVHGSEAAAYQAAAAAGLPVTSDRLVLLAVQQTPASASASASSSVSV